MTNTTVPKWLERLQTLVDVLEMRSQVHPNRIAFRFLRHGETEERAISYLDLALEAKGVAVHLMRQVRPRSRVALVMPTGIGWITAFLGCLYANLIAVPCPVASNKKTTDRLKSILADCSPSACVIDEATVDARSICGSFVPDHCVFDQSIFDTSMAKDWKKPNISRESVAFLQYSSGATSFPKGICVSNRNIIENTKSIALSFEQSDESVIVSWLPLYHDLGLIGCILHPIYVGSCSILMPVEAFLYKPQRWLKAISIYKASTIAAPDFGYRLCIDQIRPEHVEGTDLSSLKCALSGAEAVRASTLSQFVHKFANNKFSASAFRPSYGLAESTLLVSGSRKSAQIRFKILEEAIVARSRPGKRVPRNLVSLGMPAPNQEVAIVDPESRIRCDEGEVGEIWISGPSVAQGYYNRPELSAHYFGATLLDERIKQKYLRTGDLGLLDKGELFFVGRIKDVIVIRGEKYHPEDLEYTVSQCHPLLLTAACVAFANSALSTEGVAVLQEINPRSFVGNLEDLAATISQAILHDHALQIVSLTFVKRGAIPRTANGKLRRTSWDSKKNEREIIKFFDFSEYRPEISSVPTRPVIEKGQEDRTYQHAVGNELVAMISSTAGTAIGSINIDHSLSDFGLDSLKTITLQRKIAERWGVRLALTDLLGQFSIRVIVEKIMNAPASTSSFQSCDGGVIASQRDNLQAVPLSSQQQRIWLLDQIDKHGSQFNLTGVIQIRGCVSTERLEWAIRCLVRRHRSLRTVFIWGEDGPLERTIPFEECPVSIQGPTGGLFVSLEEMQQILAEESKIGFSLDQTPAVRFRVVCCSPTDYRVIVIMHHLIADMASFGILARDLLAFCDTESYETAIMPQLTVEDTKLAGDRNAVSKSSDLDYWTRELHSDSDVLDLNWTIDWDASSNQEEIEWTLDRDLFATLNERRHGKPYTLFAQLLSAFLVTMANLKGRHYVVAAVPVDRRIGDTYANVVGLLASPQLVFCRVSSDVASGEFVELVNRKILGALEHGSTDLMDVLRLAESIRTVERTMNRSRLPLLFSMVKFHSLPATASGISARLQMFSGGAQQSHVSAIVIDQDETIRLQFKCPSEILSNQPLERLVEKYVDQLWRLANE